MKKIAERVTKLENKILKDSIKLQRLTGEWQGMLEFICLWDIPKELKDKLEVKIKELKAIK